MEKAKKKTRAPVSPTVDALIKEELRGTNPNDPIGPQQVRLNAELHVARVLGRLEELDANAMNVIANVNTSVIASRGQELEGLAAAAEAASTDILGVDAYAPAAPTTARKT